MNALDFRSLDIKRSLIDNLKTLGYERMTPIQAQSLPHIIDGKDIIAQAKTGSGKTAAFGLGILQHLQVKRFRIQSLVLCPTRELADQVATEIRKLGRGIHNIKVLTLCGGTPFGPQVGSLEHGAHIIVGTPGRIEEHLRKNTLKLDHVTSLVLDEADRMLDMGFSESLDNIIAHTPSKRQTLLFSATFPKQIQTIAERILQTPETVKVDSTHTPGSIRQLFFKLAGDISRVDALRLLLLNYQPESTVVFCNTKRECQEIADELQSFGFGALAMHGDLEQRERDQTLVRFANKSANILVATDVAARGLDIDTLDAVINYHLPRDMEVHTHRVGRTGRAGKQGLACSLFADKETHKLERLEAYMAEAIEVMPLPSKALLSDMPKQPTMDTLQIDGGKKQKVRAGDILGALTGEKGVDGKLVGKIQLFDNKAYVAVDRSVSKAAFHKLRDGKLKGRTFKVRVMPRA